MLHKHQYYKDNLELSLSILQSMDFLTKEAKKIENSELFDILFSAKALCQKSVDLSMKESIQNND